MAALKPSDHALIVFKAALNAVPTVGGAIASLIGDYVPLSTQQSIERATELLRDRLSTLESRIDAESVDKNQFSDLFKSCYLVIVRTTQEAKLRAAGAILANLLLKDGDPEKASYTELDHFVRCLDGLSSGAIAVLGTALNLVSNLNVKPDEQGDLSFAFEQLKGELGQFEPALLMGLVAELNALNLLRAEGRPSIPTSQYGNYPLSLTALGNRFVQRFLEA
jgi:hypothetical protein